ncbi:unnamed protein product, partial [Rotaria sp. Silwood2]
SLLDIRLDYDDHIQVPMLEYDSHNEQVLFYVQFP